MSTRSSIQHFCKILVRHRHVRGNAESKIAVLGRAVHLSLEQSGPLVGYTTQTAFAADLRALTAGRWTTVDCLKTPHAFILLVLFSLTTSIPCAGTSAVSSFQRSFCLSSYIDVAPCFLIPGPQRSAPKKTGEAQEKGTQQRESMYVVWLAGIHKKVWRALRVSYGEPHTYCTWVDW